MLIFKILNLIRWNYFWNLRTDFENSLRDLYKTTLYSAPKILYKTTYLQINTNV